jgi:acyl transferase domain-containing protein
MRRLDEIAREWSGVSVVDTLYADAHGRGDPFDRTLLTHPAIFMVEYALAQCLIEAGVVPDLVLGVSLGSFAAASVAGFIDVDQAMTAVMRQALALEACCKPGGMTAVFAEPALFAEPFLSDRSELAAVNFASHFVVSAPQEEMASIEAGLQRRGVDRQRLPVSLPFHSQWIDGARPEFDPFMRSIRRAPGRLPLVCCDRADVLFEVSADYFWDVVRHPIRFHDTVMRLERERPRRYVDVGPSGTLATFMKYGMPSGTRSTVHAILTPYGADRRNLESVSAMVRH